MAGLLADLVTLKEIVNASVTKTIVVPDPKAPTIGEQPIRRPIKRIEDNRRRTVGPPVPINQLTVPISPSGQITDEVLYEAANDPSKKYYLPRYQLAEEIVSGERRYRLTMQRQGQNWTLTVYLQTYPAPSLEVAARTAEIIPHQAQVFLEYARERRQFQETTTTGETLKAVLLLTSLEERDEVYQALSDPDRQASLTVQRTVQVAIASNKNTRPSNPTAKMPQLVLQGTEKYEVRGKAFTRYRLGISNWSEFDDTLFAPAPDLPPCGLNKNSARTWVDIYTLEGKRLYGFCAFSASAQLNDLWFAVPQDQAPPDSVYVTLNDRREQITYTSNALNLNTTTLPPINPEIALHFPQAISYVQSPSQESLNLTQSVTLEAWVNLENPTSDQKIVGKSSIGNGYVLGVVNQQLYAEFWDQRRQRYALVAGKIEARTWTHLAVTWTTGAQVIAYIDGKEVGRLNASSFPLGISNFPLIIGAAPWNTQQWQTIGLIKEVRIWNQSRTSEQIEATLKYQLTGKETGLVGYWPADEGSGTIVRDRSANANHGSFRGQVQWGQTVPLYQPVSETLAQIIDDSFFFSPDFYRYIFAGIQPETTPQIGLKRFLVPWQGQDYPYFQNANEPRQFYYLPDRFEIGKMPNTQSPTLSLEFTSPDGTLETQEAKLDYYSAPVVNTERLIAAAEELRQRLQSSFPAGFANLTFTPLTQAKAIKFELNLPRLNPSSPFDQERPARISLRDGIFDSLVLSLKDFQAVWDALFSTRREQALFTGQVTVEIEGFAPELINFQGRLSEEPTTVLEAILVLTQPATYRKTITVKSFRTLFDPPLDRPQDQILAILVNFERGNTVELNAQQLEVTSQVFFPLSDIILRREQSGTYRYKLKVIRKQRQSEDQVWRETSFETLFPDVEV